MRDRVARLERKANLTARETALPISVFPWSETFEVHWGYWGGERPRSTRTETYPIERLDGIVEWLVEEQMLAVPDLAVLGIAFEPADEDDSDVTQG